MLMQPVGELVVGESVDDVQVEVVLALTSSWPGVMVSCIQMWKRDLTLGSG
jgi:hypothetical protein